MPSPARELHRAVARVLSAACDGFDRAAVGMRCSEERFARGTASSRRMRALERDEPPSNHRTAVLDHRTRLSLIARTQDGQPQPRGSTHSRTMSRRFNAWGSAETLI